MRIELLKKGLIERGHDCAVLNIGASRLIPSHEYETVLGLIDFVRKVWRYSRQGYVAHTHANGEATKGLGLALIAQALNVVAGQRCALTFHAGVDQPCFPRRNAPLMVPVYWLLFAIPERVVCNSESVRRKIIEYGVRADKIYAIPAFTRQYLEYSETPLAPEMQAFYGRFQRVIFSYIRMQDGYYLEVLMRGFAAAAAQDPAIGLLLVGAESASNPTLWAEMKSLISELDIGSRIHSVADVEHDGFLTLLARSAVYLRTPSSDGIASSVLEALALGVPVVASENGLRPDGVITYEATDPNALATRLLETLARRDEIALQMPRPDIRDTLAEEIALLADVAGVA